MQKRSRAPSCRVHTSPCSRTCSSSEGLCTKHSHILYADVKERFTQQNTQIRDPESVGIARSRVLIRLKKTSLPGALRTPGTRARCGSPTFTDRTEDIICGTKAAAPETAEKRPKTSPRPIRRSTVITADTALLPSLRSDWPFMTAVRKIILRENSITISEVFRFTKGRLTYENDSSQFLDSTA